MKLRSNKKVGGWRRRYVRALFSFPNLIVLSVLGGSLTGVLCLGMIVGARIEQHGNGRYIRFLTDSPVATRVIHPALSSVKAMIIDRKNVPGNIVKAIAAGADLDRFVIDIKHLDYQKLAFKREQALSLGVLFADRSDYVPATISLGETSVRARIRLKGDLPDHYNTDKWSLRIKIKGDNTLLGMKNFSLQRPGTRNDINEWVILEALRREGVLAVRYHFVDVTINGKHMGIYALEEHFEKRLLEHAEYREGPIIKFDEDLLWYEDVALGARDEYGSFTSAAIDGYIDDPRGTPGFERAVTLLDAFRRGQLRTSDVFDCDKLATFVAMADLCGARGIRWENLRFYYNPVTSRLEPIGFDTEVRPYGPPISKLFCFDGGIRDKLFDHQTDDLMKIIFSDLEFFTPYVQALQRMSSPEYLDDFLAAVNDDLHAELSVLHRERPHLEWSDDFLRRNQDFIRAALSPARAIHAYRQSENPDRIELKVGNIQSLPVEIVGLSHAGSDPIAPVDRVVLSSKRRRRSVDYVVACFAPPDGSPWPESLPGELAVHYRIVGTSRLLSVPVYEWPHMLDSVVDQDWLTEQTPLDDLPFLSVDDPNGTIRFRRGSWTIDRNVVLPRGYVVSAGPGVRLNLRSGAKIISYSPIVFRGSDELPVTVESSDSTGQGIIVIQAGKRSTLQHVVFDNLGTLEENGWQVPGAVTFYESPVDLDYVQFRRNRSEDALNIIRTTFTMVRTVFVDTQADAFDGDFAEGQIIQSAFLGCKNDAIDLSGCVIEIKDVRIDGVGDKALSAGEESTVTGGNIRINDAELGIVSKDLSTVSLRDVSITNTRVAFAAYRKKPEFGQAVIEADQVEMENIEKKYLIEFGSRVTVNGRAIEATQDNVKDLLYGVEYGRSSE